MSQAKPQHDFFVYSGGDLSNTRVTVRKDTCGSHEKEATMVVHSEEKLIFAIEATSADNLASDASVYDLVSQELRDTVVQSLSGVFCEDLVQSFHYLEDDQEAGKTSSRSSNNNNNNSLRRHLGMQVSSTSNTAITNNNAVIRNRLLQQFQLVSISGKVVGDDQQRSYCSNEGSRDSNVLVPYRNCILYEISVKMILEPVRTDDSTNNKMDSSLDRISSLTIATTQEQVENGVYLNAINEGLQEQQLEQQRNAIEISVANVGLVVEPDDEPVPDRAEPVPAPAPEPEPEPEPAEQLSIASVETQEETTTSSGARMQHVAIPTAAGVSLFALLILLCWCLRRRRAKSAADGKLPTEDYDTDEDNASSDGGTDLELLEEDKNISSDSVSKSGRSIDDDNNENANSSKRHSIMQSPDQLAGNDSPDDDEDDDDEKSAYPKPIDPSDADDSSTMLPTTDLARVATPEKSPSFPQDNNDDNVDVESQNSHEDKEAGAYSFVRVETDDKPNTCCYWDQLNPFQLK